VPHPRLYAFWRDRVGLLKEGTLGNTGLFNARAGRPHDSQRDADATEITSPDLLLLGDEVFHHCLAHQIGRQQALSQNEVMKFLLVEFSPELRLDVLS
jgi:hypothetical protein